MAPFIRKLLRMKTLFHLHNPSDLVKHFGAMASVRKKILSAAFFITASTFVNAQQTNDTTKVNKLDEVLVSAIRVTKKTPVSFSNLTKEEIRSRNLGQDIPILMNFMPSVVTTSDAGNGIGYTGIRVRGSDATRVNVTINGVPYNDAESHGTFWVNMPDFSSSVGSLQLQRGVGTSTNGAGAFGASLNLATDTFSKESSGELSNSFGSFNTRKHTLKFSSGLMNDNFELSGRFSNIDSQGYIDRAASDLKSYFLQGTYVGKTTLIKALIFGGTEKTYQSWYGVDAQTLENDRTFNYAGIYTDVLGNTQFYDNQTDNYQQHHFQLHWNEKINPNWSSNIALHYTKGNGYYEEFKEDESIAKYGLTTVGNEAESNLVRQKWLDNDFYGTTFSLNYKKEKLDLIFGGSWNQYLGDHFGKVIWTQLPTQNPLGSKYYQDEATKTDANTFLKVNYQWFPKWNLFGDLQYRNVRYNANGVQPELVNDVFSFLNPKAGVTYTLNPNNAFYFSYAKANREPNRTDYENGTPNSESLDDYELGWRHEQKKAKWNANLYYMKYKNQLILTGELDDVGNPIRSNTDKSYRLGAEVELTYQILKKLQYQGNVTYSTNTIEGENGADDKQIAFSPSVVSSSMLVFQPIKSLKLSWLQKYVGEQYLSNAESETSKLSSYMTHDLNFSFEYLPKSIFKAIQLNGLVNNIMNKKYVSNGADYGGGAVYYYPQAGINFLVGLTLIF